MHESTFLFARRGDRTPRRFERELFLQCPLTSVAGHRCKGVRTSSCGRNLSHSVVHAGLENTKFERNHHHPVAPRVSETKGMLGYLARMFFLDITTDEDQLDMLSFTTGLPSRIVFSDERTEAGLPVDQVGQHLDHRGTLLTMPQDRSKFIEVAQDRGLSRQVHPGYCDRALGEQRFGRGLSITVARNRP